MKLSSQRRKKKKIIKKSEETLPEVQDTIKQNSLCILAVPEGGERKNSAERLFKEIMAENDPNLEMDIDIQVHEAQGFSNRFDPKRFS